jgi:hypothetical protein
MRFTREYAKLSRPVFTTIRKNTRLYQLGARPKIRSPKQRFRTMVIERTPIRKADITEDLARSDGECSREEVIALLEKWYGPDFDDFVLLRLAKEEACLSGGDTQQPIRTPRGKEQAR